MDIVIGHTARVNKDGSKGNAPKHDRKKKKFADRRKNKQDRRRSVRDGVFVTLSGKKDRRVNRDRRRKMTY